MVNGSLLKVDSIIAECSFWSILQYFWPALSNNRSWKPIFWSFVSGRLRQGLLFFKEWGTVEFEFWIMFYLNNLSHTDLDMPILAAQYIHLCKIPSY